MTLGNAEVSNAGGPGNAGGQVSPPREQILGAGAIRVFGDLGEYLPSRSVWNEASGWKRHYTDVPVPDVVIAESFLGEQYAVVDSVVVRWDPETGETESKGLSEGGWIAAMEDDPSVDAPVWLLQAWELANGALPLTQHLAPKVPFVLGGEFELGNMYAADAGSDLAWRAQLAQQIRDLPDGAEVTLHVRWEDR